MGTAPYDFGAAMITARGRYENERVAAARLESEAGRGAGDSRGRDATAVAPESVLLPPVPVGSPFGFTDIDWETVSERRSEKDRLHVVLGHQFQSPHFETANLRMNVEAMFTRAVAAYNENPRWPDVTLHFSFLTAGYGEHLFNEIARDIIGSDIAVFEMSDLNPNVMLEIGVALTWGVRVLLIKLGGRPRPPSDISGQTWADYTDSAARFVDPDHEKKLVQMIERAVRKKGPWAPTSQGRT